MKYRNEIRLLLLLLLFISLPCFGQEVSTYLIYLDKIAVANLDSAKNFGYKNIKDVGGQPYRITHFSLTSNTNYAVITIEAKNGTETTALNTLISANRIKLIQKMYVENIYDKRKSGHVKRVVKQKFNDFPNDMYIKFK